MGVTQGEVGREAGSWLGGGIQRQKAGDRTSCGKVPGGNSIIPSQDWTGQVELHTGGAMRSRDWLSIALSRSQRQHEQRVQAGRGRWIRPP